VVMILRLRKNIRGLVESTARALGLERRASHLDEKYSVELEFQTGWAREFKDNKSLVLEYWRKFRYLDEIRTTYKIGKNTRILDVGCGISTVLHFVDGERYGIDPL